MTQQIEIRGLTQNASFIEDAKRFLALDDDVIKIVMDDVAADTGFVGRERISEIANKHITSPAHAESASNFIYNLDTIRRGLGVPHEVLSASLSQELINNTELSGFDAEKIASRLTLILTPTSGREKQAKALSVLSRTGAHAHDLSIVCDIRPVFDESAARIDGFVPITLLRFTRHHLNNREAVEVRLNENDLQKLAKETERALLKLQTLKDFIKSSGSTLPNLTQSDIDSDED